jgi:tetratricopeptide (TPR) repeat protein
MIINNNIDFDKIWRFATWYTVLLPLKFALQCCFFYFTLPLFFGTTSNAGLAAAIWLTVAFWFSLPLTICLSLFASKLGRMLLLAINPMFAENAELKKRRKNHLSMKQTLSTCVQKNAILKANIQNIKFLPASFLRYFLMLAAAAACFPSVFVRRDLTTMLEFTLAFVALEWLLNITFSVLITKDYRRAPDQFDAEGNKIQRTAGSAISAMLEEVQESQSIEFTRHNLAIEMNPTADAYFQRGLAYLKTREPIPAIDDFEKVMALDPQFAEAWENRADAYQSLSLHHMARNDLLHALKTARQHNPAICARLEEKLKNCGTRGGFVSISGYINSSEGLAATSSLIMPNSKALENSQMESVQKDLQADVRSATVYLRQANLLLAQSDFSGALNACNKAIELSSDMGETYRVRAQVQVQLFNIEAALRDYDSAIKLEPENADAWLERARIKLVLEDFKGVVKDCTHALTFAEKNYQFKLTRGQALVLLNRLEEGIDDLSAFINQWEKLVACWDSIWLPIFRSLANSLRIELRDAYEQRAIAYDKLGDLDKAAQDTIKAAKLKERMEKKSSRQSRLA